MTTGATLVPATLESLQAAVRGHRLVALGGGATKRPAAAIPHDATRVDMRGLAGIVEYTPAECVVTALGGTRLDVLDAALAREGHYLPFDPPLAAAGATIGGAVAAGLSGSGRLRYGGIRDFITGVRVVDGAGRLIRSGGQVVKNAAGFLLHHAVVGSAGRFGAIAEVSLKVFPAPAARLTLRASCVSLDAAMAALLRVRDARVDLEALDLAPPGDLWVRVAGPPGTLEARAARVEAALGGPATRLSGHAEAAAWEEASEFAWAGAPAAHTLIKAAITPHDVTALDGVLGAGALRRYACAGSVAWIAWPEPVDTLAGRLKTIGVPAQVARGATLAPLDGDHPDAFAARVRAVLDPEGMFR